jgi:hypothetical protein
MWWRRWTRRRCHRCRRVGGDPLGLLLAVELVGRVRNDRPDRCRGHRRLWRRACSPSAQPRCRGDRGRPPEPSAAPSTGQVRHHRRHRSGPGGSVGPGNRRGQDGGRQRGGDAGPAHRQAFGPRGPHHVPQPDPPPGLDCTRRAAGTVPASVTGHARGPSRRATTTTRQRRGALRHEAGDA